MTTTNGDEWWRGMEGGREAGCRHVGQNTTFLTLSKLKLPFNSTLTLTQALTQPMHNITYCVTFIFYHHLLFPL